MKTSCFLILTAGLLVAADGPRKTDPAKDELDNLRGTAGEPVDIISEIFDGKPGTSELARRFG